MPAPAKSTTVARRRPVAYLGRSPSCKLYVFITSDHFKLHYGCECILPHLMLFHATRSVARKAHSCRYFRCFSQESATPFKTETRFTLGELRKKYQSSKPITAVTAYDYPSAKQVSSQYSFRQAETKQL